MKNIYFIINCDGNHKKIQTSGSGASEVLFYMTAYKLSTLFKVTVFNRDAPIKIQNVNYVFLPDNMNPNIEDIHDSIVIVQRHFYIAADLHKINPSNKYFVWSHDYLENDSSNLFKNYSYDDMNQYLSKNNIPVISVSNFHKNNVLVKMPNVVVNVIYNALFPELYKTDDTVTNSPDKNNIVFASNWGKGLDRVLNIGQEYYKANPNFKLILMKPSYCEWEPDFSNYPFIKCLGNIKDKGEYCKIIQNSLCVLTTTFPETFGCVFAEALHLGVPVIGDNSINAGFHEIIDKEYMCNFNNLEKVVSKIEKVKNNNPKVSLDDMFYEKSVIQKWINLLF
jgi:glycosyltransferase involved in cell wall biosynthesis